MRTLFFVPLLLFLCGWTCQAQQIEFETTEINYGEIPKDSDGERVFRFTNIGKAPLVIKHVATSCGCTVPAYPKEPIMPGEQGEIIARYATSRVGGFTKYLTVQTNQADEESIRLKIQGKVLE